MTDIEQVFQGLQAKQAIYTTAFAYAEGNQPLRYATERLKEAFSNITTHFSQNWVSVIINSALDRMSFKGWSTDDETVNALLTDIYSLQEIAIESYNVHKSALITHEAFVIAWKEEEDLEVYYNDPRLCFVQYDPDHPKRKQFAGKWYKDNQNRYNLTLYYPDRLEYYQTKEMKQAPTNAKAFDLVDEARNPYGIIPVFHFALTRSGQVSELTNVISLQDAVNKLFADMMVAAEFGAFRQRYVISNTDTTALKNAPNEIWNIPSGEGQTSVGEFTETPLNNYLMAIDKIANSIAIISRTPKHYFYTEAGQVSGEALIAMESPLIAKVEQYEHTLGTTWKELASFMLLLNGISYPADNIKLIWEPSQSVQPLMEAQTIKANRESGIPLETVLKWAGKPETEIKEIQALLQKEKKEQATQAKLMLEQLKLENQQSNEVLPGEEEEEE